MPKERRKHLCRQVFPPDYDSPTAHSAYEPRSNATIPGSGFMEAPEDAARTISSDLMTRDVYICPGVSGIGPGHDDSSHYAGTPQATQ